MSRACSDVVAEISLVCAGCDIRQRQFIAEAINIIKHSGLRMEIHALGTNFEGPIDQLLVAIKHIRERCHELGAPKVEIHLNISSRCEPCSLEQQKESITSQPI